MQVSKTKTVRFAQLVKESGRPELVTLWAPPGKDRQFAQAIKAGKVLSVRQINVGTKKDFGIVGFVEEPGTSYYVFPKSIKTHKDKRVVGIKYEAP